MDILRELKKMDNFLKGLARLVPENIDINLKICTLRLKIYEDFQKIECNNPIDSDKIDEVVIRVVE